MSERKHNSVYTFRTNRNSYNSHRNVSIVLDFDTRAQVLNPIVMKRSLIEDFQATQLPWRHVRLIISLGIRRQPPQKMLDVFIWSFKIYQIEIVTDCVGDRTRTKKELSRKAFQVNRCDNK